MSNDKTTEQPIAGNPLTPFGPEPNIYCIQDYPDNIFGIRVRVPVKWNPVFREWEYSDCSRTMLSSWFKKYPHLFAFTNSIFPPKEELLHALPPSPVGEAGDTKRLKELLHAQISVYEGLCYRLPKGDRDKFLQMPSFLESSALIHGEEYTPKTERAGEISPVWLGDNIYRKIPIKVRAVQWKGDNRTEIELFVGQRLKSTAVPHQMEREIGNIPHDAYTIEIPTREGVQTAIRNDWVIEGDSEEHGKHYWVNKPDYFKKAYERPLTEIPPTPAEPVKDTPVGEKGKPVFYRVIKDYGDIPEGAGLWIDSEQNGMLKGTWPNGPCTMGVKIPVGHCEKEEPAPTEQPAHFPDPKGEMPEE